MTKLNKLQREDFIINNYQTMKTTEIQKILKISPNDIYKILRKNNIKLRGNRLKEELSKRIAEEYISGLSIEEISKKLKVGKSSVGKQLKLLNVKTRSSAGLFVRKYPLDQSIFEKIDSFEKAQFLGLIYSDGTLSKINPLISIRLREDDKLYLQEWSDKLLKTTKPIGYSNSQKYIKSPLNGKSYKIKLGTSILDITSRKIYNDALKIGLCPGKTWKNLPMPNLPHEFKIAFVLGLFEGDGCISACKKSRSLTIACQENMANDLKDFFEEIGIFASIHKNKFVSIVQIARWNDIKTMFRLFYENASIFMKRKKEKFQLILSEKENEENKKSLIK